jgi:hypothetical protein
MLTVKASVAAVVLAATAVVSAGAGYLVTKATLRTDVTVSCPKLSAREVSDRGVPLGGRPLPTNQGKKW